MHITWAFLIVFSLRVSGTTQLEYKFIIVRLQQRVNLQIIYNSIYNNNKKTSG